MPFSSQGTRLFERALWVSDLYPRPKNFHGKGDKKTFSGKPGQTFVKVYASGHLTQMPYSYNPKIYLPTNPK